MTQPTNPGQPGTDKTKRAALLIIMLIFVTSTSNGQAIKRGNPDRFYWTIWFKTTAYPPNFDSTGKGSNWVQSFFDPWEATRYYTDLKTSGKVLIWRKYLCRVDTSSVRIDSFDLITRKYSFQR